MAFSLFGKKPPPAPDKPAAKKAPASAAAPPRPAAPPPADKAPSAEKAAPEPKRELESLDFTAPGAIEVQEEDRDARIQLDEGVATDHPAIEEAAILYANGQDEAALATLEAAIDANNLGPTSDQAWAMLFDLYQLMEKREAFDQRAMDYSVKFEKSPPTWVETVRQSLGPALTTGGYAFVAFSGLLGEGSDKQIRQLEKVIAGNPVARVEFVKLQDVDVLGAAMLLKTMKAARKAKCELVMTGAEKFAELLKGKIEVGRRDGEDIWLLLLELYQQMGMQEPFEEWALNYAITFEVSPPSWENRPAPKTVVPPVQTGNQIPSEPNVFPLTGEMYSAGSDAFRQLIDFSTSHDQVVIDCSALKRMDFVSAGMFLNTLTNLQITGKTVMIRRPNQLVLGLFGVLGINQVAQIERRKF